MNATLDNGETCAKICALINTRTVENHPNLNYKGGFDVSLPAAGFTETDEGLSFASQPLTSYCKDVCYEEDTPQGSASGGKSTTSFTSLF